MTTQLILNLMSSWLEPLACVGVICLMYRRQQVRQYPFLTAYLATRALANAILIPVLALSGFHIPARTAYSIYFYGFWTFKIVEAGLGLGVIYSVYNLAMAPLKGLQRLGRLMFRWAAAIAVVVSATTAIGPHVTSLGYLGRAAAQLQETQSVLTLCLLLFVCLAIRPMGLSYSSKVFGVSLGLGLKATIDLVDVAWFSQNRSMASHLSTVNNIAILSTIAIWCVYFVIPEPRRRMIILPTTSPFLRWNQISLALGDEPGFVAVGDVTPDMFAPAEVEVMRRASVKMRDALIPIARPHIERSTSLG